MVKRPLLILLLLFYATIFLPSCSKTIYTSSWQAGDFSVLRKSETAEPLRFYDAKSKLQYSISNDAKNIYLCIKVVDEQFQTKILLAGMQINVDTIDKKGQQISILYPLGIEKSPKISNGVRPANGKDNPVKTQFLLEPKEMQLSGFKLPINGIVPLQNKYGISARIEWDATNIMYYKATIPFNTFYKETLTQVDSTKIFNFSIKINALDMLADKMKGSSGGDEMMHQGVNMSSGEIPGNGGMNNNSGINHGGGMPNSGGMGNDGTSPNEGVRMPADNPFSEKNIVKIKIRMVVK